MADAVQAAIYKLQYDGPAFQQSADVLAQGNERVIDSFSRVEAKYDPLIRAEMRRQSAIEQANRFLEEGIITEDRYAQHIANVNSAYDAQAAGAGKAGAAVAQASAAMNQSWSLNRGSLMSLQAAGINAAQAIASGMSVMRVATTEGAQVIGALAGSMSGGLSIAISAAIAGLSILANNTGIFSGKADDAKGSTENLTNAQKLLASAYEVTTGKITEQSNALDRYMAHANDINTADLLIQGQKLADLLDEQATMAAQIKADSSTGYGVSAEAQKAFDNLSTNVTQQENLVRQLSENSIVFSKQMSDAAYAAAILEDDTGAVDKNVRSAAAASRALKDGLQGYKDRFSDVMRGRVSFSQRLSVMSDNINATAEAGASRDMNGALRRQIDTTQSLDDANQELAQSILDVGQAFASAGHASQDWMQEAIEAANAVSDAIIKMEHLEGDAGGAKGIAGLLAAGLHNLLDSPASTGSGIGATSSIAFPGHATGTDFTVGGTGGSDSKLVAFRATPGERVRVDAYKGQHDDRGGGDTHVYSINIAGDADELKIERVLVRHIPNIKRAAEAHIKKVAGSSVGGTSGWARG